MCVECKRHNDREYNRRNPEAHLARALKSAASRPDAVRAYRKAYYAANRQEAIDRAAEWAKNNRERMRAHQARNHAKRRAAPSGDIRAIIAVRRKAQSDKRIRCYWCGIATSKDNRHLDHIIPLSRGGADSAGNLCISCVTCNLRKNAKPPEEWAGQHEMSLL